VGGGMVEGEVGVEDVGVERIWSII
jgi:hypothetical protein